MQTISKTTPVGYEQIGVLGAGVHIYCQQLKALLKARLTDEYLAELLSTPVYDEQGGITWQSALDGPVIPYHELTDARKKELQDKLDTIQSRINNVIAALDASGDSDHTADAERLRAALLHPNEYDDLFDVSGMPVLINWGLDKYKDTHTPNDLFSTNIPHSSGVSGTDKLVMYASQQHSEAGQSAVGIFGPRHCRSNWLGWIFSAITLLGLTLLLVRGCVGVDEDIYNVLIDLKRERSALFSERNSLEAHLYDQMLACSTKDCNVGNESGFQGLDSSVPQLPGLPELPAIPEDDLCGRITQVLGDCDTGEISATLGWDSLHDLDIGIETPSGEIIWWKRKTGAQGGTLNVDSNADPGTRTRTPVENISWPVDATGPGRYRMLVRLHDIDPQDLKIDPVPYTANIKINDQSESVTGSIPLSDKGKWKLVKEFQVTP